MSKTKILILGAAGRDFHDFNTYFRDNPNYEVVAFTATQIPDIEGRQYPPALSGKLYPKGIPIYDESEVTRLIQEHQISQALLSYSDLPHQYVMNKASEILAAGADFRLLSPQKTMVPSIKPVISICAVRTGCGKSQTSRKVVNYLKNKGLRVVALRHPMPYGDLAKQACQRFAEYADLDKHECTIEEREEYEPYINEGLVIFSGVDYEMILRQAEKEADVIIWDGGNNDFPFIKPNFHIVITDPHRAGHELKYHPGEANLRMANLVIVNKVDTAQPKNIETVLKNIKKVNPKATVIQAKSPFTVDHPELIEGKRVVVVEDGPTLTHGEMGYGVGFIAAKQLGAKEIIDPKPNAIGSLKTTFEKCTQLENLIPAMGYGRLQMKELEQTINNVDCDAVIIGTPIDLGKLLKINKPTARIEYRLEEVDHPHVDEAIEKSGVLK